MKSPLLHIAGLVYNNPLAIVPEKLEAILHSLGPRFTSATDAGSLQQLLDSGVLKNKSGQDLSSLDFSASWDDDDIDSAPAKEKPYRLTESGIAILPIRGALMKRGGWMSSLSGCSSYDSILRSLNAAMSDDLVKAVLFDVDSPGGTTHGCFELADAIYQLRGTKPMWSVANDLAASAAYALASSTDRIFLTRTAGVGSIGVFALHCETSKMDEKVGVTYTYIYAGDKKVDGNAHEPLSRSARKDMQAEVSRQDGLFDETVARNRDTTVSRIDALEAELLFAASAIPLLADELGTFESALAKLEKKVAGISGKKNVTGLVGTTSSAHTPALAPSLTPAATVGAVDKTSVASKTNSCDIVSEKAPVTGKSESGEKEMANRLAMTEEEKIQARAKVADAKQALLAAQAAAPDDEPDGDEDPDDEEKKKEEEAAKKKADEEAAAKEEKKKAGVTQFPLSASSDDSRIDHAMTAELCEIAGMDDLTGKYIRANHSVSQVRKLLRDKRAKLSAENPVHSSFSSSGSSSGGSSVDRVIQQARTISVNSGGKVSVSKAMEDLLMQNPGVYEEYDDERRKMASDMTSKRDMQVYVQGTQQRYMRQLGLSPVIDNVPRH